MASFNPSFFAQTTTQSPTAVATRPAVVPTTPAPSIPTYVPAPYSLQGMGDYVDTPRTLADLVRNDLITDPSYQFRFNEGQKAIENRAAAMGKRFSGGMFNALTDYGQDYASTEFANAYNRIAGLSGTAQTAGTTLNNAGQNYATTLGNLYGNIGDANANASMAQGNAYANMANTAGQFFSNIDWSNPFGTSGGY